MPPWQYKPTHLAAWLSEEEKRDLIRGLEAAFGAGGVESGERGGRRGRVIRSAPAAACAAACRRRDSSLRALSPPSALSGCVACSAAKAEGVSRGHLLRSCIGLRGRKNTSARRGSITAHATGSTAELCEGVAKVVVDGRRQSEPAAPQTLDR